MSGSFEPRFRLRVAAGALITALTLVGCSATTSPTTESATTSDATTAAAAWSDNVSAHTETAIAVDTADAVEISLADNASTSSAATAVVDGNVITISEAGTYRLSGNLSDGQVVVNSTGDGQVILVLDGVSLTNQSGSALVVTEADEVVVHLAEGSQNSIADGSGYDTSAEDAPNAAVFSMADLTIQGDGTLTVTGNTNDGIASKDGLVILSGTVKVTSVDDAVRGKDYLVISGGELAVTAEGDGLKSDNEDDDTVGYVLLQGGTVTISAGDDAVHAEGDLAVTGGEVTVAESVEGLEGATVLVSGGDTSIVSSDDGLNATSGSSTEAGGDMQADGSLLTVSGGTLIVDAEGDGMDSNGTLTISGGTTVIAGPTNSGNGALDANGALTVTGGTLIAAGSAGMAQTPDADSTSGWVSVNLGQSVAAGETITITDGDTVIASYTAVKQTESLIVADPALTSGTTYQVYLGGTAAGDAVGPYSKSADLSGATQTTTVVANESTTGSGGQPDGAGGPGGQPRRDG